jgi:hypothetical protein
MSTPARKLELGRVGESVRRVDAIPKVTGEFAYASDLFAAGMLWGHTVRSPHAHARILSVDRDMFRCAADGSPCGAVPLLNIEIPAALRCRANGPGLQQVADGNIGRATRLLNPRAPGPSPDRVVRCHDPGNIVSARRNGREREARWACELSPGAAVPLRYGVRPCRKEVLADSADIDAGDRARRSTGLPNAVEGRDCREVVGHERPVKIRGRPRFCITGVPKVVTEE